MTEFRKGKPPSKRGFAPKSGDKPSKWGGKKEFSREAKLGSPRKSDGPRRSFDTSKGAKRFDREEGAAERGRFVSPRPARRQDDRRPDDRRSGQERRDFSERRQSPRRDNDRKSFGDKKFGDRKPRSRGDDFSERRPPRPRTGERQGFDDRRTAPPRREGERRSFEDRRSTPRRDNDRRPFGDKKFSDRKPFKKDFGDKPFKKDFAAKKPFAKKEYSGGMGAEKRKDDRKGHELVIYGIHAVLAALQNEARQVKTIWATETTAKKIESAYDKKRHPKLTLVEKSEIDKYVPEDAVHQGLAIAVEPLQETFLSDLLAASRAINAKPQLVVVLDEVTDPHNVGAVMRSMAAFGAKALVVHKYNAPAVTGVMAKIATGAVEHIPMVVVTNLASAIEELQIAGYYILGLDERATIKLTDIPRQRHMALVMGAEGEGLREKTRSACDAIASIPSYGPIASLNVSNAAAIALYEVTREA